MESRNEPIITIRGLEKSFGTKKVLKGIDLDVYRGLDKNSIKVLFGQE